MDAKQSIKVLYPKAASYDEDGADYLHHEFCTIANSNQVVGHAYYIEKKRAQNPNANDREL